MRRQRVGAVAAAIDDEDVEAGASEQHAGGGTRGASTDDDDVVAGWVVVHRDLRSGSGGWDGSAGVDVDHHGDAVGHDVEDGGATA